MKKKIIKKKMKILKFNSIKSGIKKGLTVSSLPPKIAIFYSHPLIRILRVIGGFSAVIVLTKNYTFFPYPLDYVLMFLAIIQLFQIVIISIIKITYSIRKLIYKPEEFEVRNSPLDKYATQIAKLIYCWKFTCSTVGGGVGIIASGAVVDQLLEEAGQDKIFLPFLGNKFKFILNTRHPQDPNLIYNNFKISLNKLSLATQESELFKNAIKKISDEDLSSYNLTNEDKEAVQEGILDLLKASELERTNLRNELIKLLESKKN